MVRNVNTMEVNKKCIKISKNSTQRSFNVETTSLFQRDGRCIDVETTLCARTVNL